MASIRQGNPTALWHELVVEGEQKRNLALGEELQSYLVFALMRHLTDGTFAARVLALDWLQACERCDGGGVEALREVGDRCLLIAGMFPKLAERRRVDHDYYQRLGRGAYAGAATRTRDADAQLLQNLVEGFGSLVEVLQACAPGETARSLAVRQPGAVVATTPRLLN